MKRTVDSLQRLLHVQKMKRTVLDAKQALLLKEENAIRSGLDSCNVLIDSEFAFPEAMTRTLGKRMRKLSVQLDAVQKSVRAVQDRIHTETGRTEKIEEWLTGVEREVEEEQGAEVVEASLALQLRTRSTA